MEKVLYQSDDGVCSITAEAKDFDSTANRDKQCCVTATATINQAWLPKSWQLRDRGGELFEEALISNWGIKADVDDSRYIRQDCRARTWGGALRKAQDYVTKQVVNLEAVRNQVQTEKQVAEIDNPFVSGFATLRERLGEWKGGAIRMKSLFALMDEIEGVSSPEEA